MITTKKTRLMQNPFKLGYFVIAIGFIQLVTFTSCHNNSKNADSNEHEQAHFVTPGTVDKNTINAQRFFNAGDYQKAIYSFESIADLTNPELQYFYAIALIETNHYRNAEIYLNHLKSGTSVYKEKAVWYLALSKLKQQQPEECKAYLKQIPADSEDYEKAQKLLKDLN